MQEKEKLPYNVEKSPGNKYGFVLPYILFTKRKLSVLMTLKFRVTELDFLHLTDDYEGQGKCFAYVEDLDKWFYVKVFKYWVVSWRSVTKDEMKFIKEEILS